MEVSSLHLLHWQSVSWAVTTVSYGKSAGGWCTVVGWSNREGGHWSNKSGRGSSCVGCPHDCVIDQNHLYVLDCWNCVCTFPYSLTRSICQYNHVMLNAKIAIFETALFKTSSRLGQQKKRDINQKSTLILRLGNNSSLASDLWIFYVLLSCLFLFYSSFIQPILAWKNSLLWIPWAMWLNAEYQKVYNKYFHKWILKIRQALLGLSLLALYVLFCISGTQETANFPLTSSHGSFKMVHTMYSLPALNPSAIPCLMIDGPIL